MFLKLLAVLVHYWACVFEQSKNIRERCSCGIPDDLSRIDRLKHLFCILEEWLSAIENPGEFN